MSIRKTIFDLDTSPVGEAEATDEMEVYRAPQSKSFKRKVGEAAAYDVGTEAGELPTNGDLGSASLADTGTGAADVPTNGDLGTASLVDTGTEAGEVPTNADLTPAAGDVQIWDWGWGTAAKNTSETAYLDWRDLDYDVTRSIYVRVLKAGVIRAGSNRLVAGAGEEGEARILKNGVAEATVPFTGISSISADITVAVGDIITFQLKMTTGVSVEWRSVRVFADKAIGAVV